MSEVRAFRPFKLPRVVNSDTTTKSRENKPFCDADLARSGLTPEDLCAIYDDELVLPAKATAGYLIPYCGLDGRPLTYADQEIAMYRIRLKYPEYLKESRYTQPSGTALNARGLPSTLPYIHPALFNLPAETLICAEGEKKTVCILKYLNLPAFGIGGCQLWADPNDRRRVHPWIARLFEQLGTRELLIVPDGDILRYDICVAYSAFATAARRLGVKVHILHPPDKIDDLIVREGPSAWEKIPRLSQQAYIESPDELVTTYDLAYKSGKNGPVIHQNLSNVLKLLSRHPAFPKIWRNEDTNQIMFDEAPAIPGHTEVQLTAYFQHNLGFEKISEDRISTALHSIAIDNRRSPFLDRIRGFIWDGTPRLDTWMSRLWGVQDSEFTREVASKWLISACARMSEPGTKIDWMLIAQGAQGTGKTSMPDVLFYENTFPLYGEHDNKDLHMLFHSGLVVNFDELDSFSKKDASTLLAMITSRVDSFRPPYGRAVDRFPRRFVFYGCCNRAAFLQHNPDGYRRFPVIHVPRILDFVSLAAEREQLWAEAFARYVAGGVDYWEVHGASEVAKKYAIVNPLEDVILQWLDGQISSKQNPIENGKLTFTVTQLMHGIDCAKELRSPYIMRDVHHILVKLGAELRDRTRKKPRHYAIDPGQI